MRRMVARTEAQAMFDVQANLQRATQERNAQRAARSSSVGPSTQSPEDQAGPLRHATQSNGLIDLPLPLLRPARARQRQEAAVEADDMDIEIPPETVEQPTNALESG